MIKETTNGGVMASREQSKCQNKENKKEKKTLIYIKYKDHVLFKNSLTFRIKPSVRETIGWVAFENSEYILICSDLPFEPLPNEKIVASGLVVLKTNVIEKYVLDFGKQFKLNSEEYIGQN